VTRQQNSRAIPARADNLQVISIQGSFMRPRTPSFIWLPFVFSIGTLSWALLLGALAVLSVIVLAPAVADVRAAETRRNNVQATLELQDKYLTLRDDFIKKAASDAELMQRLAALRPGMEKKGQETLILHPQNAPRDTSVRALLAQSLPEVTPAEVPPLPWYLAPATNRATRTMLLMFACGGLVLAFVLGVRFDRRPVGA
jgi:hypothetical protein